MLTIWHKPFETHHREKRFCVFLRKHFSEHHFIPKPYLFDSSYLDRTIDIAQLLTALEKDTLLSSAARDRCKEQLKALLLETSHLKVALQTSDTEFDFVIVKDGKPYFWEFHEDQHHKLKSTTRAAYVFSAENDAIEVGRGLQRLVRDVWRVLYFRPYTVIWYDWFEANQASYVPTLQEGYVELSNPGRFSFAKFCESIEPVNGS